MSELRIFSTFTGIGGFEIGIENAVHALAGRQGLKEKTERQGLETSDDQLHGRHISNARFVGYSEIDEPAISVYEKHFKGVKNYGDITKINTDELPEFDCLVGGFPCQAFSIAGRRRGFEDTRGTLFFELARILRAKRPRLFVFENVKGLLNHDGGRTFTTIIAAITELGYDAQWQVVNSKDFGVPQNRERIIIVGHLGGTPRPQVFPIDGTKGKGITRLNRPRHSTDRVYDPSGASPAISTMQGGGRQPYIVAGSPKYENGKRTVKYGLSKISPTITATYHKGADIQPRVYIQDAIEKDLTAQIDTPPQMNTLNVGMEIRKLTPLECERLQAFPDDWTKYDVMGNRVSDSQRYKMCGNAVTTNVVQAVFERLLESE